MQLHWKQSGGERRRRVAAGSSAQTGSSRSAGSTASLQAYTEDAHAEAQPRISEFIPQRPFSLFVVFLLGLVPIAAVTAVYVGRVTFLGAANRLAVAGMELYGRGTIAAWLASMMMMAGASACLMVYNTRRHRTDDYRGRYGFWLWAAVFFVVLSIDAIAGLHQLIQAGCVAFFRDIALEYGARCWLTVVGLLIGGMSIRALIDMRQSRGACSSMLLGLTSLTMSGLHYLNIYRAFSGQTGIMLMVTMLLVGQFLIVYSLIVYARFVFRVAQGDVKIVARKRKQKTPKEPVERRSWFRRRETTVQANKPTPDKAKKPQRKKVVEEQDDRAEDDKTILRTTSRQRASVPLPQDNTEDSSGLEMDEMDILTNPNLTKAERRKLRKKIRREQNRAA